jgi:hypothetical protein
MDAQVKYLLSLDAIRDRAKIIGEAAKAGKLSHFDVHEEQLGAVADYVTGVIKVLITPRLINLLQPRKGDMFE